MSDVNEIAKGIVNKVLPCRCESCERDRKSFAAHIAAALAAERAKFAAFADEKGEPRKINGTLPVTVDEDTTSVDDNENGGSA